MTRQWRKTSLSKIWHYAWPVRELDPFDSKVTHTDPKAFRYRKFMTLTDEFVEPTVDAISKTPKHPNVSSHKDIVLGHRYQAYHGQVPATLSPSKGSP